MSRRRRIWLVVALVATVVVVVGQLLFPGTEPTGPDAAGTPATPAAGDGPAAPLPAANSVTVSPGGASRIVAGVPMGYGHHPGGAKAAAAGFTQAYGTLVAVDEESAVAAKRAMTTAAAADQLVAEMRGKLAALRRVWPVGAVSYRVAPLAVRIRMDGPDAAAADVWYVGVVAGRGLPTYEEWVTQSYRLVWERDDWRIASETEEAGPRPDPGRQSPASAAELETRLAGFEALA